jgi:hypothetical protein
MFLIVLNEKQVAGAANHLLNSFAGVQIIQLLMYHS